MLKKTLILTVLIFTSLALAEKKEAAPQEYPFHGTSGEPSRFFDSTKKSYKLPGGVEFNMSSEATRGHTTAWSDLKLWSKCPNQKKFSVKHEGKVCGLTHFVYDAAKKEVTLHMVDLNATSVDGHCTGDKYTKTVQLCD